MGFLLLNSRDGISIHGFDPHAWNNTESLDADAIKAVKIVFKYISKTGTWPRHSFLIDCQHELIDAGLEKFAEF